VTEVDFAAFDLLTPNRYGTLGYPHDEWRQLRAASPVCRIDHPATEPYWAVTTQELIRNISVQPANFTQKPTINVKQRTTSGRLEEARTIVHMDPPEHTSYRRVAARTFTPRSVGRLEKRVREIARSILDRELSPTGSTTIDFVDTVASWHPLRVISELMGIPEADQDDILRYTNMVLASTDPEFRQGEDAVASVNSGTRSFLAYMGGLAKDRRECPMDDLATVLARAEIDGEPMPDLELISYYMAMMIAGHDTTRNVLAGGLLALLENPEQLKALREDGDLWDTAVDEILRWTSVVIHFSRTAQIDCEMAGHTIKTGDRLALFYPSANRDEAVYHDPYTFRVDRAPNPHMAFGYGEHYCIGQALARLEVKVMMQEFLDRLSDIEVVGPVHLLSTNFVGGVKHLPVRCTVSA
jgi:cytochrome P450